MLINIEKDFKNIKFSAVEKSIVRSLNQIGSIIVCWSAKEMAEKTYTTGSTITKLIHKLGFEDLSTFKKWIYSKKIKNLSGAETHSINKLYPFIATEDALKTQSFYKWNKMLNKSRPIVIIAGGTLVPLADYLKTLLKRKGYKSSSYEIHDSNIKTDIEDDSLVIIISNSGLNRAALGVVNAIVDKTKNIVSVTTTETCNIKEKVNWHIHGRGINFLDPEEYDFPYIGSNVLMLIINRLVENIE